jgi:hypothetical protein
MNQIAYEIAVTRRDDLLRAASKRRLASQSAACPEGDPSATRARRPRKLQRLWHPRFARLVGPSETYGERTLDGGL